jgi:hypothetical protein
MTSPHVEYVAHHWILLAVPAFVPAIIVVSVVLYVALRDRRSGSKPDVKTDSADQGSGPVDERRD